jgi:hypothetical protein
MWAEQAIFTSLARDGRAGYHVVARSMGLCEPDVAALETWSPTHGFLIVDASNRTSLNFHPMPEGRYALARTCEGLPEYSGRGGRQIYTHALIFDEDSLRSVHCRLVCVYREALALGYFLYQFEPPRTLARVRLGTAFSRISPDEWWGRAQALGLPPPEFLRAQVELGRPLPFAHRGNRLALAECLLDCLGPEVRTLPSFSTSLQPSTVRPYQICLT